MEQTANYGLNQWAKADRIQMEDFNRDNAKLDAALKAHETALTAKLEAADLPWVTLGTVTDGGSVTVEHVENYRMFHLVFQGSSENANANLYWGDETLVFIITNFGIDSASGLLELFPLPNGGIFMRYNTQYTTFDGENDVSSYRVNTGMATSGTVAVNVNAPGAADFAYTLYGLKK